jgi:hypothetical protein
MKSLRLSVVLAMACLSPLLQGCGGGHYYQITDPKSGDTYYTRSVDHAENNTAISFVDAKTGKRVTLDRMDVHVLSEKDYGAAVNHSAGG